MKQPNKDKKKPGKTVAGERIPETNSGYRMSADEYKRAKKVQKKGVNNKLASQGKDGKIKPRENKSLKEKLRLATVFRDRKQKNHPDYAVQDKKVKALQRRLDQHNKSAHKSATIGTAQKNMFDKTGGKGDKYVDKKLAQQNKSDRVKEDRAKRKKGYK